MKNDLKGKYLHHKGKFYDVLGEARDVGTNILYIIYRQDYGYRHWWIRPRDMFFDTIVRNGEMKCRFTKTNKDTNIPEIKPKTFRVRHTETGEEYLARYLRFYEKYFLSLKNERGEQMRLELSQYFETRDE